jgi:hypothetical protein
LDSVQRMTTVLKSGFTLSAPCKFIAAQSDN